MSKELLKLAYNFSKEKHKGQKDRAGKDYFRDHILNVFKFVGGTSAKPEVGMVALLHDTVEDTDTTIGEIREMFGNTVASAVDVLTKKSKSDEIDYGYLGKIKSNQIARIVKLADLKHNLDLSRLSSISKSDLLRNQKYKKSIEFLRK
jgi:(p)ppGpp synthase/HD superfamily hydrolase